MEARSRMRSDGRTDLTWPHHRVALTGVGPSVTYRSGAATVLWRPRRCVVDGDSIRARRGGLTLSLRCRVDTDAVLLTATLRNDGPEPVHVDAIAPLAVGSDGGVRVGPDASAWSVFRNGYQSWSGTGTFRAGEVDRDMPRVFHLRDVTNNAAHPAPGVAGRFRSELVTAVVALDGGPALCAGFLDESRTFGGIELEVGGGITAACELDGVALAPGAEWTTATLRVAAGDDGVTLLEEWAEAFGAAAGARVADRMPAGWCSWYYYFTRVTERDVLENLASLAGLRDEVPCDYVMVDDGHQAAIGDWLRTNAKFPSGMAEVAARIRSEGFDAGIWLAPFLVERGSDLFTEHPGWCVETERGRPRTAILNPAWGVPGRCHVLDTTDPEVLAWLEELARTIVHDWGFRILKLDFLYAAALPGLRHDVRATRAGALRRGLEAIRRGAGDDAFLLGCGCPLGPAVGVVDAMRIGADVAPYWSNAVTRSRLVCVDRHGVATKHAVRDTAARAFMHGRLWFNDPDCLMVRTDRTRLTEAEVRSLVGVMGLTGGMIVTSDRLATVPPERLRLLQVAHGLLGGRCRVEDLFESDMPELFVTRRDGEVLVGVCNFADVSRRRRVPVGRYGVPDGDLEELLGGGTVRVTTGVADVGELAPHDCRVLRWRETVPRRTESCR